ncbi:MAG: hypothetical protein JKY17_01535 [Magnetovibrio sp.]|nr:hypothetical protein [Magnetovibrio sp.]
MNDQTHFKSIVIAALLLGLIALAATGFRPGSISGVGQGGAFGGGWSQGWGGDD